MPAEAGSAKVGAPTAHTKTGPVTFGMLAQSNTPRASPRAVKSCVVA